MNLYPDKTIHAAKACFATCAALTLLLSIGGCEAQKPTAAMAATSSNNGKTYSEPALMGRVIDIQTKQPIAGAVIYGHYATSSGTQAGGSKFGEHVKSFEAVTDAGGNFKLDAWSTGDRKISGEPRGKFPMIAVYKPGYNLEYQHLDSISQFRSRTSVTGGGDAKVTNATVDWSAYPFELTPTKTELERYNAFDNAGVPMMMVGECGWEAYAGLLLVLHNEKKRWIRAVIPFEQIDSDGYGKGSYFHPDYRINGYSTRTHVDTLIQNQSRYAERWTCKNTNSAFVEKDKK